MGNPPQDPKGEKNPAPPESPSTTPQSQPPTAEDAAGSDRRRNQTEPFEKAYNNYLERRQKLWHEYQQDTTDAYRTYAEAVNGVGLGSLRRHEEAYRNYLEAAHKPGVPDEIKQQAHRDYSRALEEEWGASSLKHFDAYRNHVSALRKAWEEYDKGCSEAYQQYLRELREAWQAGDLKTIEAHSLSAISLSQHAVAYYASDTSGYYRQ